MSASASGPASPTDTAPDFDLRLDTHPGAGPGLVAVNRAIDRGQPAETERVDEQPVAVCLRRVDYAIDRAVDLLVDRILDDPSPESVSWAVDLVARDILTASRRIGVHTVTFAHALLDDGTALRFVPAMVRVAWTLQFRQMLGLRVDTAELPPVCSRGAEPSIATVEGSQVWTLPYRDPIAAVLGTGTGPGRTPLVSLLRNYNDGEPVLTSAAGARLWSVSDARLSGVLLDAPWCRIYLDRDGTATVHDTAEHPDDEGPAAEAA